MAEIHPANEDRVEYPHDVDINRVVSDIGGKLKSLGPPLSPECCIYMVPKKLRSVNNAAYTPQVVSIGPLHHGKKTLKTMEKNKLRYLDKFLERALNKGVRLEDFVSTIKGWESNIRSCYAETFDHLNSDKFVEMILVDVGFIFELFLRFYFASLKEENDFILYKPWLEYDIYQDLYLLENQLPFFVLEELYDLAFPHRPNNFPSFLKLTCHYFSRYDNHTKFIQQKVKHFTDLLRYFKLPDSGKPEILEEPKQNGKSIQQRLKPFTDLLISFLPLCGKIDDLHSANELHDVINVELKKRVRIDNLYSATELHDAGVKFEVSSSECWLDKKFSDGVLTIPCLELYDGTEAFIRNLMALEQCQYPDETYICTYVKVMDDLINTTKDVDLLVQKKIIANYLGDQRPVATLFNKLCTHIIIPGNDSWYTRLCKDLNAYYEVRCHRWQAILRREYFSTPWRIASTIAAIILLVLTFTQTICSIMFL